MQPRGDRSVTISFRIEQLLGWALTLGLCLIPVVFWSQVNPPSHIHTFSAVMINIGRVTGLVGMVMYSLNFVYATRLRFLEYLFGGLNRVYIAHHVLGGLALIFLSLHPLFLALRLIKISLLQVTLFLLPNGLAPASAFLNHDSPYHSQVVQHWALLFGIVAFWGLVGLLLVTFFIQIPYRIWLFTHKFLGLFFAIGGLHVVFITSDTSVNTPLRIYILTFAVIGVVAFTYRLLAGKILVRHYKYSVQQVINTGSGVFEISLAPLGMRLPYKPGQFLFIRFLGAEDLGISHEWHPFSITSSPDGTNLYLAIKGLGDYTKTLVNLQPGIIAEVEGAYGKFGYTNYKNPNQIWVAGGIGITPFLSMARSLPAQGNHRVDLYYSVRTASELIDWAMLYDAANTRNGQFRIIPYIGDQMQGYLNADYIEQMSGSVKDREIYICGPPTMMKTLRKQFRDKSVPATSIHTEEFAMS